MSLPLDCEKFEHLAPTRYDTGLGVRVERRPSRYGFEFWTVLDLDGRVLSRHNEWQEEPDASERDERYQAQCMFNSAEEAFAQWLAYREQRRAELCLTPEQATP